MSKLELVSALTVETNISKREAAAVSIFFAPMTAYQRVEKHGIGSFFVKHHKIYPGRNSKQGSVLTIKPKKLPFFKSGKGLRERVDY